MRQPAEGSGDGHAGRPLHLLFVINSAIVGGAERHTFDLAAALMGFGWRSTVFAMKGGTLEPPPGVVLLQPEATCSLAARLDALRAMIRSERPDLIISVNERPVFAAWVGRLAARAFIPLVAILHSTVLNNTRERLLQLIYNRCFNRVDSVVFVSENQRNYWWHHGIKPRRCETILNGVDVDYFSPTVRDTLRAEARQRFGFPNDALVLGLCAVMRPEKNHTQLLEVVARLAAEGRPAKALLVGDGPCRSLVAARARTLGIEDRIVLTGMARDVRPYIAAFDIGILCSVSIETLSLAALEIMSMGVPMVMSDLSGASEIVDGQNGQLFPVRDETAFAAAVRALSDADLRLAAGKAARRSVERLFNRRDMVERYHGHFVTAALSRGP